MNFFHHKGLGNHLQLCPKVVKHPVYLKFIQELIKSRLKSGTTCYYSVKNLLSSSLLYKKLKIKIHRTIILPVVVYGFETWSLTLREERRLRVLMFHHAFFQFTK